MIRTHPSFFFLLLLLLAVAARPVTAQRRADSLTTVYLHADSLREKMPDLSHIRFRAGDDSAWALPDYDDGAWRLASAYLPMPWAEDSLGFHGICWMRLRLVADSSVANTPLALMVSQQGASEIYLDGKLLYRFGKVGSAATTHAMNPGDKPMFLSLGNAGPHVLAIRYANYRARRNLDQYFQALAGMSLQLGHADRVVRRYYEAREVPNDTMLWFGLFFAFSVLNLILFLYNRRRLPYLLFAIFTLCLALTPIMLHLTDTAFDPVWQNRQPRIITGMFLACCVSFSAFLNATFPPRKARIWRYLIPATLALLAYATVYWDEEWSLVMVSIMIASVSIEAIIVVVLSVVRKIPGARILGVGILVLTLFVLTAFLMLITGNGLLISSESTAIPDVVILIFFLAAVLALPLSISAFLAWGIARTNKDLAARLSEVAGLSQKTLEQEAEKQRILLAQNETLEREVAARTTDLRRQMQRSDDLLLNILPAEVAEELKEKGSSEARQYHEVSVLFTDFVNFTSVAERLSPQALVEELNACFTAFDAIMERHGLEKIKTIGDAYMAVCGLPVDVTRHAQHCVQAALEIRDYVGTRLAAARSDQASFDIRIGIHSGPVVAGIIGVKKFAYDVWGDAVNMAARMEQSSEAGKVNISEATHQLVKDEFACTPRGKIAAKNKGAVEMFFVEALPT